MFVSAALACWLPPASSRRLLPARPPLTFAFQAGTLALPCPCPACQGRTHALRRKLKDLADFVFVDAPHELPAWGRQQEGGQEPAAPASGAQPEDLAAMERQHAQPPQQHCAPAAKRAWLLVPEQYAAVQRPAGACRASSSCSSSGTVSGGVHCSSGGSSGAPPFASDPAQYERQTAGWQESQAAIQQALTQLGLFDGVMGLSQGAAVAAVLVAQQWQAQQAQPAASGCCTSTSNDSAAQQAAQTLQFAVLCSGFCSRAPEHARLLSDAAAAGGITVPSLHIFGGGEIGSRLLAAAGGRA